MSATAPAAPTLSLVAPVHNGAAFIAANIETIVASLEQLGESFEVIVVSDGSTDGTAERAASVRDPRVRVLRYDPQQGKGVAVTCGLAHARGRLVGFLDSDLDIHPDVIVAAARRFEANPEIDAVIGSKRHPRSNVKYPLIRRVYSRGFQLLVQTLFRVNVRDTQVGAKLFRREMIDCVAPLLLIKHYAYDLELLAVGAEFGFDRVEEMPIELNYRFSGTGIGTDAVRHMLLDTLAIAYRIHLRHYYVRRFAALQRRRIEATAQDQVLEDDRIPPPAEVRDLRAVPDPDDRPGADAVAGG